MYHGRVEIRVFDMWGTICDDGFGDKEATVICRMLGHHRLVITSFNIKKIINTLLRYGCYHKGNQCRFS
jgi:hypothetical protein